MGNIFSSSSNSSSEDEELDKENDDKKEDALNEEEQKIEQINRSSVKPSVETLNRISYNELYSSASDVPNSPNSRRQHSFFDLPLKDEN